MKKLLVSLLVLSSMSVNAYTFNESVQSCEGGFAGACYNLAVMYATGEGVKKDDAQVAKYYQKACEGKVYDACYNLGVRYYNGQGVKKDFKQAFNYFKKASNGGIKKANINLGLMNAKGEGVAKNQSQAISFYKQACNTGEVHGCANLGLLYEVNANKLVKKKFKKRKDRKKNKIAFQNIYLQAINYYKKACEGGSILGCNNIGVMYDNGQGVKKSTKKAKMFFGKACDLGSDDGCKNLGVLKAR